MPDSLLSSPLIGSIEELSDVFVDTCICNDSSELVFLSLWGRDTAIQELLARITLPASDKLALSTLHLDWNNGQSPVFLEKDALEKRLSRSYGGTLFGSLNHVWLFDRRLTKPDQANHSAFVMECGVGNAGSKWDQLCVDIQKRLWSQVVDLAPFPILDHWINPVLPDIWQCGMITPMRTLFGSTRCWQINLNIDVLEQSIGTQIRSHSLQISIQENSYGTDVSAPSA